ncbi:MAG: hypothetical protein RR752_07100, partial [Mucinivorans sp.]
MIEGQFSKTQFLRAVKKETKSLVADSEKRSFQEQLRKTNFSRADSEKRSFSQKVLGDFFKSHDSARRLHG